MTNIRNKVSPFLTVILLSRCVFLHDIILNRPRNIALEVGQSLRITCATNSSQSTVRWYHTPVGSTGGNLMNIRDTATLDKYSEFGLIPGHNGSYDLYTIQVQTKHAGLYKCKVAVEQRNGSARFLDAGANLIVLKSKPTCNSNQSTKVGALRDGDVVEMWCRVQFRGNWVPTMTWHLHEKSEDQLGATNHTIGDDTYTSVLVVRVNSSMNGWLFACTTDFKETAILAYEFTDERSPDYTNTWTADPILVMYGPRNLTFTPKKELFEIGDQINCWADGNPPPSYQWKDMDAGTSVYGPNLTVKRTEIPGRTIYKYKCTALNDLESVEDIIVFTLEGPKDRDLIQVAGVIGLSGVIGIVALVSLGICLVYRKRTKKKAGKSAESAKNNPHENAGIYTPENYHVTSVDQSLDLISTSSSNNGGGSSHTYADIEEQLPASANYNELAIDHRELASNAIYRGLVTGSILESQHPVIADKEPIDYYNLSGDM